MYTICGTCALWLGLGTARFAQGLMFNFSEKQRERIKSLHKEIDNAGGFEGIIKQIDSLTNENIGNYRKINDYTESSNKINDFLEKIPVLKGLIKFRFSTLPAEYIELSGRLTRGEFVDYREIKKANR
jgi:hypothetical protein